jgi:Signal transduction histidine kinase
MRTADGDWKWTRNIGRIVERDETGEPVRAVGINIDIDDQRTYEQTLKDQRNDLKVLNQMVRHDIRNKLHIVVSYAKMLTDNVNNESEEYLQKVIDSTDEAIDITQTAGDVTEAMLRSEADLTPRNLSSVLQGEIAQMRENHEQAIISAEETLPDITVLADKMLESVFRNLLSNAITHNDKELPEVTVSTTVDEEVVRVRIADNGPGIPDTQKGQIFCEGEKGIDSGGTGMGLYLVETLVDRYDGAVWAEDNEPEGSVFTIELRRE